MELNNSTKESRESSSNNTQIMNDNITIRRFLEMKNAHKYNQINEIKKRIAPIIELHELKCSEEVDRLTNSFIISFSSYHDIMICYPEIGRCYCTIRIIRGKRESDSIKHIVTHNELVQNIQNLNLIVNNIYSKNNIA